MTQTKVRTTCPLCFKKYSCLSNHLVRFHQMLNIKERRLLLNLASNRVNVQFVKCPIPGCHYKKLKTDRHILMSHNELTFQQRKAELFKLRVMTTLKLLEDLRKVGASPPMISTLDQDYINDPRILVHLLEFMQTEVPTACMSCEELQMKLDLVKSKYNALKKRLKELLDPPVSSHWYVSNSKLACIL